MSKARAIILSVTVEGLSQAETARRYQVSKGWVSKLIDRHRTHGEEAFQPRSRRPHSSPTRVADVLAELIVNLRIQLVADGLDAGPETIRWHLEQHHDVTVSTSTIRRRLLNAGLITPEPKKRPRSSYIRFTADLPNECWQSDFTHWRLADGTDTEILTWLDDHSRYALSVTAHQPVTGTTVVATFDEILATHGVPASVLTDNALVYTTRFAGGRGGRNHLETHLADLGIHQKHSAPNHPTTCGKVERFQQTMKLWLRAQPAAQHVDDLNQHLTTWTRIYNHERPHRSLDRTTPATAYPKPHRRAQPQEPTTGSDTTASTPTAPSPSAEPARCTTSASAAPTPDNPSSSSSTTSTSASSTPPPAISSATSPLTQPAATNPKTQRETPEPWVRAFPMSRDITRAERVGFEPTEGVNPHFLSREAPSA